MDRSRGGKFKQSLLRYLTTVPVGTVRTGPSKDDLRRQAQEAMQSGVQVKKIPAADPQAPKKKKT